MSRYPGQPNRPRRVPAVEKHPICDLGRIVEPTEIAHYAKRNCPACFGARLYYSSELATGGQSKRIGHACGCARDRFLIAHVLEIGYDPEEKGVPVRWLKACDPRAVPAPAKEESGG